MPRSKKIKLPVWDERMFVLIRHCISTGACESQSEFLQSIGFPPENISQVKNQKQSFRLNHIHKAAAKYGVNLNWLFGFDSTMKRKPSRNPITQLKEAVSSVESLL